MLPVISLLNVNPGACIMAVLSAWRLFRLVLHVFQGMAICGLLFPWIGPSGRQQHIRRWSRQLLGLCGVQLVCRQSAATPTRCLIIANHISWLDTFVINAVQPCRFVAKSDIRSWPCIGWLCAKTGTIFISRSKLSDVRRIFQGLVDSIQAGERVAFFPEGTTAAQGQLLPFHANLFEAAIDAGVPVQAYALRYLDAHGKYHAATDFIGEMTLMESVLAILRAGAIRAELIQLPAIPTLGAHRRELAAASRQAIAGTLAELSQNGIKTTLSANNPPETVPYPQAAQQSACRPRRSRYRDRSDSA